jgi:hypothetical protein
METRSRVGFKLLSQTWIVEYPEDALRQFRYIADGNYEAIVPILYQLSITTGVGADGRLPATHIFDYGV